LRAIFLPGEAGEALSLVVVEVNACLAHRQSVGQYVGCTARQWSRGSRSG
jgi:hypothetical protein